MTVTFRCTPEEAARLRSLGSSSEVLRGFINGGAPKADDVDARPGPSVVNESTFNRWQPHYVWTLHHIPGKPAGAPPLAVRRRILESMDGMLKFEIARSTNAATLHSERRDLDDRDAFEMCGMARTHAHVDWNDAEERGYAEVHAWVYDHNPTEEERAAWLHRHAIEQAAIRNPPKQVWGVEEYGVVRRFEARRTLGTVYGHSRFDLTVNVDGRAFNRELGEVHFSDEIDMLDLLMKGSARLRDWTLFLRKPGREEIRRVIAERFEERQNEYEAKAWAQGFAESLRRPPPPTPLEAFGLKNDATRDDVQRAYRKRIANERLHPDQGGDAASFAEVTRQRDAALAAVKETAA